jgi:hypothetical protein
MLAFPSKDECEDGMSFGQFRIELYSPACQLVRLVQGLRVEKVAVYGIGPSGLVRVRKAD